ncbi:hypothetical protein B0H19DRAFT_1233327 [Mycena capillaripes]|nr:hypothetical protein B0H19DRAFT_1233327 [Mycena capillaripes]
MAARPKKETPSSVPACPLATSSGQSYIHQLLDAGGRNSRLLTGKEALLNFVFPVIKGFQTHEFRDMREAKKLICTPTVNVKLTRSNTNRRPVCEREGKETTREANDGDDSVEDIRELLGEREINQFKSSHSVVQQARSLNTLLPYTIRTRRSWRALRRVRQQESTMSTSSPGSKYQVLASIYS